MNRRDALELFMLSGFWGMSFLLIKLAGTDFPPVWVAFLRSTFGALVLAAALRVSGERFPPRSSWGLMLLVAVFNNAFPWLMFAIGEQTVSSNIASILNATTPLFTLLIAWGLRDAHLHARMGAGVLLGLSGVALTVLGGMRGGQATALGVTVILLAALSYGLGGVLAKRTTVGFKPVSVATAQLLFSSLLLMPFAALGEHPHSVTLTALAAVAVLGIVGSGLAYLVFYRLLTRVSSTQVSAVTYLLPIWGLFWGRLSGEAIAPLSLVGVVVILAGLLIMNARRTQAPQAAPTRS